MLGPISPIRHVPLSDAADLGVGKQKSGDFGSVLEKSITGLEQSREMAAEKARRLLSGKPEEVHSVVMATQRAQLEFELFLEVRNKVVQAYQEIMRMQV
jgi:flagellar hook-basal body complex protein FliE